MTDIFAEIVAALRNRESVVLATIVASSGSTPLPPGSTLLVKQAGKAVLGTVGGGAVEANVIRESIDLFVGSSSSTIRQFELSEGDSEQGMICGGTVEVLIERMRPEDLPLFSQLIGLRNEGADCILLRGVDPTTTSVGRVVVTGTTPDALQQEEVKNLLEARGVSANMLLPLLQRSHRQESVERVSGPKGEIIIQPIVGSQPLIIFGGGHVGRSLSSLASLSGFSITVVDEREEYARSGRFPEAAKTILKNWSAAFEEVEITPSTSIVIVTSGHKSDAEVLRHAVTTRARYVGMIGSRKKVAATFAQLVKDGVPLSALQRAHAPIGLDIGAVTAEEIAVSILAELIRARRGFRDVSAPLSSQMISWFDHPEA
ncbi:MAG: XdhC family protein [Ignavibacteriales bacterium]|nr:XdhC family protein [Ignavibacteriales bacterium]